MFIFYLTLTVWPQLRRNLMQGNWHSHIILQYWLLPRNIYWYYRLGTLKNQRVYWKTARDNHARTPLSYHFPLYVLLWTMIDSIRNEVLRVINMLYEGLVSLSVLNRLNNGTHMYLCKYTDQFKHSDTLYQVSLFPPKKVFTRVHSPHINSVPPCLQYKT